MQAAEKDLILKAQQGNTTAFGQLVKMHDQKILQMIRSIVGSLHDAYDVHQDTFIRAFRHIEQFRFESEFSTWVGRIAINLSLNWRKRERIRTFFSLENRSESNAHWEWEMGLTEQAAAEKQLMKSDLLRKVYREMEKLPDQQRAAFLLKHLHAYKIREIAEMMNLAEGTVKNHLFRATQKIQKKLGDHFAEIS